jgi:dihydrofolate synthase/folylpolyglutamate synthase
MNYKESLNFIHKQNKFGTKLGLENIRLLADSLDRPQDRLHFIHVAGTNGKGSICTLLSYALKANGYKTGLFISPYVVCFNERIQIDNHYIENIRLADITTRIKAQIEQNLRAGIPHPTEFELVTAIALTYFAEEGVDIVIWETGLGGRLDATNMIDNNVCSVIGSISKDHTEHLGDTLEEIAYEKACIIKKKCPCILMHQDGNIQDVVRSKAESLDSPLYISDDGGLSVIRTNLTGQEVLYQNHSLSLPLPGAYQIKNLAVALKVLEVIASSGFPTCLEKTFGGIEQVTFPGRFEVLKTAPLVIIDAAHNEEGIRALNDNIETLFAGRDITLFFGKLKDKDFGDEMTRLLTNKKQIYTLTPPNPRAMKAAELAELLKKDYCVNALPVEASDILHYIDRHDSNGVYIFAGSIYLISALRNTLLGI